MTSTTIILPTAEPHGAVDITDRVRSAVATWPDGPVLVSLRHTTAGLALGPTDEGQMRDYARFAERAFDELGPYEHVHADADIRNGREHLLSTIVGTQLVLRVIDGEPVLGRWQRVLLFEFDGPSERTIHLDHLHASGGVGAATTAAATTPDEEE